MNLIAQGNLYGRQLQTIVPFLVIIKKLESELPSLKNGVKSLGEGNAKHSFHYWKPVLNLGG